MTILSYQKTEISHVHASFNPIKRMAILKSPVGVWIVVLGETGLNTETIERTLNYNENIDTNLYIWITSDLCL